MTYIPDPETRRAWQKFGELMGDLIGETPFILLVGDEPRTFNMISGAFKTAKEVNAALQAFLDTGGAEVGFLDRRPKGSDEWTDESPRAH